MEKYILKENIEKELQHNADWARAQFPSYESIMTLQSGHRLSILSTSVKTNKGEEYDIALMYLAPHRTVKGINNCLFAGICAGTCLDRTGKMPFHAERRTRLTLALYLYPIKFMTELLMELSFAGFKSYQKNKERWIRLNGTSDIRWERLINIEAFVKDTLGIAGFYDYTKYPKSQRRVPAEYRLTYSLDEQDHSQKEAKKYLKKGYPVAVVLNPSDYKRAKDDFAFTDGDRDDYRFRDSGIVVLRAKRLFKGMKYKSKSIIQTIDSTLSLLS